MVSLIDIGVNFISPSFKNDLEDIIQRAIENGVCPMISTGSSLSSSIQSLKLAQKYPGKIYSTAGVHPHDVKDCTATTIQELEKLCKNKEVVAVGECGLDFNRNYSPQDVQKEWFDKQVALACHIQKPLFLHDREASNDFVDILKAHKKELPHVVVHCFTGTLPELKRYLDLGFYIGITGWICDERRGLTLKKIVKHIPLDRLMIETDAPFLLPRNITPRLKSTRNEPAYLVHVLNTIAHCMGKTPDEIAENTTKNAQEFFSLPKTV